MNDAEIREGFANMLRRSRSDGGKSQQYMADALSISKKTVQNWESGYSCPDLYQALRWFNVLKLQAMPYYLNVLYPDEFGKLGDGGTDQEVEDALIRYIKGMRPADKRKLLFITYGEHGSAFNELIEMLTAHFHTPEPNRITIAQNICTNYEVAEATGTLVSPNRIMPDVMVLKRAIIKKRNRILGTEDEI